MPASPRRSPVRLSTHVIGPISFFRQEPHALDETPGPGEHHVAVWRRLVKAKTARQPPVRTGHRHECERTDLSVGWIECRAVSIEALAEALRVQGGVTQASNQRGDDLRRDPARVMLKKPVKSPPLEERGKGVHIADVDQNRSVAAGHLRYHRV